MAAPYKYHKHADCLKGWAKSELEHVGRIIATEDPHIQKSYAMSTVNGMAHLKDALYEAVNDPELPAYHKSELLTYHGKVIRVMKHLIDDFDIDTQAIKNFNTEGVLSNMNAYLKNSNNRNNSNTNRTTRKNKRNNNNRKRKTSRKTSRKH